jgi:hypothetical protein
VCPTTLQRKAVSLGSSAHVSDGRTRSLLAERRRELGADADDCASSVATASAIYPAPLLLS